MANWDVTGLAYNGAFEGGVMKLEFAFSRSSNELFKNKIMYFGAYLLDQYVEVEEGTEHWLGGELAGMAPVQGEELAKLK